MASRRRVLCAAGIAGVVFAWGASASAKPLVPDTFCDTYSDAGLCAGPVIECHVCHTSTNPVTMNGYGDDVLDAMLQQVDAPLSNKNSEFEAALPAVLAAVEALDSDGDGFSNLTEITEGTFPGDAGSVPTGLICPDVVDDLDYKICQYDVRHAARKIGIDFCGVPPTYEQLEAVMALTPADQVTALHGYLDACLDGEFWLGADGALWDVAHNKIRPVTGLEAFAGYNYPYDYFVYTQIDGHDVRDVLVGQFAVERIDGGTADAPVTTYQIATAAPAGEPMQPARRAGMLTQAWPLFYNTMFTALPRNAAAQAYRAFLGLDIAREQGLFPVQNEPVDFDGAGVTDADCAFCHSTLDPLSYPFSRYNGLQSDAAIGLYMYDPDRITKYFVGDYPAMATMGEGGVIFGQNVTDLLDWAQVAANSDQFFIATTTDYWKLTMGEEPTTEKSEQYAEFTALWEGLKQSHSVEAMLHDLIDTEAYGAP